jgi:TonB family protein
MRVGALCFTLGFPTFIFLRFAMTCPRGRKPMLTYSTEAVVRMISCLLIGMVMTGCASLSAGSERWQLATGQACYAVKPDSLRAELTDFADTTALNQLLSEIPELRMAAGDTVLLSMGYDSTGVRGHVSAAHPDISDETLRGIETILQAHIPERGPARRHANAVVIRTDTIQVRSFAPRSACEPALANREEIQRSLERLIPLVHGRRQALVWIKVNGRGLPEEVKIHRSSGEAHVDEDLLRVASRARFAPALYDAHLPVPVWIQIPLSVNGRGLPPARD